jgi:integrase
MAETGFGSEGSGLPATLDADLAERAVEFARNSRSSATKRAYAADWRDWEEWCLARGFTPIPATPQHVGLYLTDRASSLKVATLQRRIVTIGQAHRAAGQHLDMKHPAVRDVFQGICRTLGRQATPKTALTGEDLRRVLKLLPSTLIGIRDRAVLLVGFAGAFRRSELVALNVEDLSFSGKGVAITIRRSKTDQEGLGATIGIPRGKKETCPVGALRAWLRAAQIDDGAVFRRLDHRVLGPRLRDEAVAEIVKSAVARAGFDYRTYAAHSLRSGFCTTASGAGADVAPIMNHVRHKSLQSTRRYIQPGDLFENRAVKAVDL